MTVERGGARYGLLRYDLAAVHRCCGRAVARIAHRGAPSATDDRDRVAAGPRHPLEPVQFHGIRRGRVRLADHRSAVPTMEAPHGPGCDGGHRARPHRLCDVRVPGPIQGVEHHRTEPDGAQVGVRRRRGIIPIAQLRLDQVPDSPLSAFPRTVGIRCCERPSDPQDHRVGTDLGTDARRRRGHVRHGSVDPWRDDARDLLLLVGPDAGTGACSCAARDMGELRTSRPSPVGNRRPDRCAAALHRPVRPDAGDRPRPSRTAVHRMHRRARTRRLDDVGQVREHAKERRHLRDRGIHEPDRFDHADAGRSATRRAERQAVQPSLGERAGQSELDGNGRLPPIVRDCGCRARAHHEGWRCRHLEQLAGRDVRGIAERHLRRLGEHVPDAGLAALRAAGIVVTDVTEKTIESGPLRYSVEIVDIVP